MASQCQGDAKEHCKITLKLADEIFDLRKKLATEQDANLRLEQQTLLDNALAKQARLDRQWSRVLQKRRSNFGKQCDCNLDSSTSTWIPL